MPRKTTRAAQGSGTIRQRSDGRWEARYTVGRDPGTNRQIQKSVYGDSQEDVRKALTAAMAAIDDNTYTEPVKMPIKKWCDIWLEEYTSDLKYLTVKTYKAQVETHIKPALGATKLGELTKHAVQTFINDLTRKKGLAPKTVKNIHGVLSALIETAVELDYLRVNPCSKTKLPRIEKGQVKPLTDEQISALLKIIDNDKDYAPLLKTILFTGLRLSEANGLTWDSIDFKGGTISITKQLQKRPKSAGGFQFTTLKNDKTRTISPAPFVMELLKDRKVRQIEARMRAGEAWQGWTTPKEQEKALVFTNDLGEHFHPQTVYNHFKKLAEQIGAPEACVHDLRHTFAVLSLQNGDDVKTVQGNLGHATAAFTLDVYGHVSEKMKQDSADRMQQYIKGISNL